MTTLVPPAPIRDPWGSYTWEDWFRQIRQRATESAVAHNDLSSIQGGQVGQYNHLATALYNILVKTAEGTYTPTLTSVANLDGSTAYSCQYMRVGDVVTVSGQVDVNPTTLTNTQLGISLPIASNLANSNECSGTACCPTIAGISAAIIGDITNNRAELKYIASDVTNQPMYFTFTYRII